TSTPSTTTTPSPPRPGCPVSSRTACSRWAPRSPACSTPSPPPPPCAGTPPAAPTPFRCLRRGACPSRSSPSSAPSTRSGGPPGWTSPRRSTGPRCSAGPAPPSPSRTPHEALRPDHAAHRRRDREARRGPQRRRGHRGGRCGGRRRRAAARAGRGLQPRRLRRPLRRHRRAAARARGAAAAGRHLRGRRLREPDGIPVDPAELTPLDPTCGGAIVEYFAGVNWDRAVRYAIAREMVGIEALSGIPGSVGATPIQNVGAYGQEVSATISRVRTWDREKRAVRTFFAADCGFAYRDSVFKRTRHSGAVPSGTGRYVVLSVTFQHTIGSLSAPIRYAQLADALGVEVGQRAPMAEVREAVLRIRASKGMVLDPRDHDTWSAGSFFTNPILAAQEAAALPADAPRFDAGQGRVKTSAAWLISH